MWKVRANAATHTVQASTGAGELVQERRAAFRKFSPQRNADRPLHTGRTVLESRLGLEFIGQHSVQDFRAETLVQAVSKQTVRDPCSRLIRPNWATDGSPVPPSPPVCFSEERRLLPEKGPAAGVKLARDDLV